MKIPLFLSSLILLCVALLFSFEGCVTASKTTPTPSATLSIPAPTISSVASKALSVAQTIAAAAQTLNTGLLAAAPSVEAILNATGNSGDASSLAKLITTDQSVTVLATPLINGLMAGVQTAVTASAGQPPVVQQAAVNAALSPAAIQAAVAPVVAVNSLTP